MLQIGPYRLDSIMTGKFALDGGAMFGVVPKVFWEKKIDVDDKNRIDMRMRSLLVQGEGRKILVDTGAGDKGLEKFNKIYRIDRSEYNLEGSLAKHSLKPEDITDIVITHLHFDHAGGSTRFDNKGRLVPAFPNARYHIQKRHFDWALNAKEREQASFLEDDFVPLSIAGRIEFHDGPYDLLPGISIEASNGHTEVQQHLLVSGGADTLFYCADMIPTSLHVPLPWIMAYDIRPLETLKEKREILKRAVKDNWILFFEHCPHVAAARVVDRGVERYEVGDGVDV